VIGFCEIAFGKATVTSQAFVGFVTGVENVRQPECDENGVGFPERFAQQALGHNSKAVHRAYAKHAEVTVPSLADWEKGWQENPQRGGQPKLQSLDFGSTLKLISQVN
jgi:hypothetical protein